MSCKRWLSVGVVAFGAMTLWSSAAEAAQWCRWQISDGLGGTPIDVNGRESKYWGWGAKFTSKEVVAEYNEKFDPDVGEWATATWVCTESSEGSVGQLDVFIKGAPKPGPENDPARFVDKAEDNKIGALGNGLLGWLPKVAQSVPSKTPIPAQAAYAVTWHRPDGTVQTSFLYLGGKAKTVESTTPPTPVVAVATIQQQTVLCAPPSAPITILEIGGAALPLDGGKKTAVGTIFALPAGSQAKLNTLRVRAKINGKETGDLGRRPKK